MAKVDTVFSGSIPSLYDRYLGPLIFEPYAEDLAGRLAALDPARVLETAAGTGIVTRALLRALPAHTSIVATDLNQPMLDHAAAQVSSDRVELADSRCAGAAVPGSILRCRGLPVRGNVLSRQGAGLPGSAARPETARPLHLQCLGCHRTQ